MATSPNAYGQINPQLVDPYPIETTLAGMAADPVKQGVGVPLLAMYQSSRRLQGDLAAEELQNQHQFARDRLQAEIAKNIADATTAAAKEPGALELLNATRGGYGGLIDPAVMTRAIQRQNMQANAAQLKTVLEGAKAGAEGGYYAPTSDVSALAGTNIERGDPTTTVNARIAAAARVAAANAGGAGAPRLTLPVNTPGGGQGTISVKVPFGSESTVAPQVDASRKAISAALAPQIQIPAAPGTPSAGVPAASVGDGASPTTPRAPAATTPRTDQRDVSEGARRAVSAWTATLPPTSSAYKDLMQGGGRPPVQVINGQIYALSPSGNAYGPIPPQR